MDRERKQRERKRIIYIYKFILGGRREDTFYWLVKRSHFAVKLYVAFGATTSSLLEKGNTSSENREKSDEKHNLMQYFHI